MVRTFYYNLNFSFIFKFPLKRMTTRDCDVASGQPSLISLCANDLRFLFLSWPGCLPELRKTVGTGLQNSQVERQPSPISLFR